MDGCPVSEARNTTLFNLVNIEVIRYSVELPSHLLDNSAFTLTINILSCFFQLGGRCVIAMLKLQDGLQFFLLLVVEHVGQTVLLVIVCCSWLLARIIRFVVCWIGRGVGCGYLGAFEGDVLIFLG